MSASDFNPFHSVGCNIIAASEIYTGHREAERHVSFEVGNTRDRIQVRELNSFWQSDNSEPRKATGAQSVPN
jgi:hypothetical protein